MSVIFTILFPSMFVLFFIFFFVILGKSIAQEKKNDHSPRLTVPATVVAKRTQVRGDHAHTTYYATFQVASGDRMELNVPHNEFGYLVEDDRGSLTFQGTRFLSFDRT